MHPWAVEAQAQVAKALDASYERESTPGDPGTPHRWVAPEWGAVDLPCTGEGAPSERAPEVPLGFVWTFAGTPWCRLFGSDDLPAVLPHFKLKHRAAYPGFIVSLWVPVVLYRVIVSLIGGPLTDVNAIDLGELPEDALREIGYAGALGGHTAAVHVLREVYKVRASGCRNMTPVRWGLDP